MPASAFDSALYGKLFGDADIAKLFADSAEVRAMMIVEGALATAQAKHGVIPEVSATAIHRAAMELQIDPAGLADETGRSAVVVPALIKAFRSAMQAPDHAQYMHWGATSQDIMDTGQILRLRQVVSIFETRLTALAKALGALAQTHADLPMAARTYGQVATPTTFGAVVASWGSPLLRHLDRLAELKPRLLCVSLSGAAGTASMLGDDPAAIRASFAEGLGLSDPGESWHSARDRIAEFAGWMTLVTGTLGKLGDDLVLMTQTGMNEITLPTAGGSSTMPQKQNPVVPSLLGALSRHVAALNTEIQLAQGHHQQRDGAAWLTEWLALPQLCQATGRALAAAAELAEGMSPNPDNMARAIDDGTGLIYAEALSFALTTEMPRPDAQAAVKDLCKKVTATGTPLSELALTRWPGLPADLFTAAANLGTAPGEARNFAIRCLEI